MPIKFSVDQKRKYVKASYIGSLSDDEVIEAWKNFYEGEEWIAGMPELIDLSALGYSKITLPGFRKLSEYCSNVFRREGLDKVIISVYAPDQYGYNLMRSYQIISKNSPGNITLFRNFEDSKKYIEGISRVSFQHQTQVMKNVFDAMLDGVCIINQDYEIKYANLAMERDFGSYKKKKCYEYFLGSKSACSWCKNPHVIYGNSVRREWYSEKTKKTYDLIDTSFPNPDGSFSVLEIFRDITEFKKNQPSFTKSQDSFRILFDNSIDPIFLIQESIVKLVNPIASKFFGLPEQEIIDKAFIDLVYPDDRKMIISMYNEQLSGKETNSGFYLRAINNVGNSIWVNVYSVRINWEGEPAIIIFIKNISKQKLTELENKKHLKKY